MKERNDIKYKKQILRFKKDARIKECFHYDHGKCSNDIILAHSIQKSGVLSLIESEIDGNSAVYSFFHRRVNEDGQFIGFETLGKKSASTFSGFCGLHDTETFKCIENNPIDIDDDEHCFLISYRGFAMDHHAQKETLKGYGINELFQKEELSNTKDDLISGSELGIRDSNSVKEKLNVILKNKTFSQLEYFTFTLDYMIPIALSASITPDYSYSNKLLNKSLDPDVIYEFVNFNVFPTFNGKTHILLSCLPEHKKSMKFIDELAGLNDFTLKKAISSIAISHVENTFFSPLLWKKLGIEGRKQLLYELEITNPLSRALLKGFFHSKLNLFDYRFRITPPNNL